MAYTNLNKIIQTIPLVKLVQLVDDDKDGNPDSGILDGLILESDNLIDAYVGDRYVVPFGTVPDLIESFSRRLTIYKCYERKAIQEMPEGVIRMQKDVIDTLKLIANGVVKIPFANESAAPANAGFNGKLTNKALIDPMFSDEVLGAF